MTTENPIEIKKDGLSQLQDGSWVMKIKVHPNDMPASLMQAPMGTRYAMALVEIGDDEQPVHKPKEKRSFHELPYSQQAAMLCNETLFQRYLEEEQRFQLCQDHEGNTDYAETVRRICGISSRSELNTDDIAAIRWTDLYAKFKAWEAMG